MVKSIATTITSECSQNNLRKSLMRQTEYFAPRGARNNFMLGLYASILSTIKQGGRSRPPTIMKKLGDYPIIAGSHYLIKFTICVSSLAVLRPVSARWLSSSAHHQTIPTLVFFQVLVRLRVLLLNLSCIVHRGSLVCSCCYLDSYCFSLSGSFIFVMGRPPASVFIVL